jgi:carbon starvation protein
MFEALFILTTIDAGTRVGRYVLQDILGNIWKPLGETKSLRANVLASVLMVGGWGYFLIQGVRDPLGGINSLWPLFGIANQMLAAIALCLATTVILKMALGEGQSKVQCPKSKVSRPALALITLLPLVWLLAVTMTAGAQKIFHSDPRIGFLAQARELVGKQPLLEQAMASAKVAGDAVSINEAEKALRKNQVLHFNNLLDAVVAGTFLVLLSSIVLLSMREWILLLARRKLAVLRESDPVWLPDYAIAEARPLHMLSLIGLAFALAKELSGEAQLERAQAAHCGECALAENPLTAKNSSPPHKTEQQIYIEVTKKRFDGVTRCC